jgi:hypothetical protein
MIASSPPAQHALADLEAISLHAAELYHGPRVDLLHEVPPAHLLASGVIVISASHTRTLYG